MQSNRLMLLIAVIAGIVATAAAFAYLRTASGALSREAAEPTVSILVTRNDLPANHILSPADDLREHRIPARTFDAMARAAVKLEERGAVRGRRLNTPLAAGHPLMYAHLVGIADLDIGPGMRAMTVRVDETGIIGGMLVPGDRVDIVVSWQLPRQRSREPQEVDVSNPNSALGAIIGQTLDNSNQPVEWGARPVLSNIKILAIGNRLAASREQFDFADEGSSRARRQTASTVTIQVSMEEALELIRATGGGRNRVSMLLRSPQGAQQPAATGSRLE
jgi:pilus assembly protein CpaB